MKIKIAVRHLDASESLRSYVIDKAESLERFYDRIISIDVVLSVEKQRQIAEFHGHLINKKVITAREESTDMYASIDRSVDRLRRQLVKFKDQLHDVKGRSEDIDVGEREEASTTSDKQIIRSETYFRKPMTAEEAMLQLDAIEKDFLVFVDVETDEVAIIYHRRDGNYGLIQPRK